MGHSLVMFLALALDSEALFRTVEVGMLLYVFLLLFGNSCSNFPRGFKCLNCRV